ncbi:MAG TPA: hypothetical protein PL180_16955 [Spirochaetota bacterium]|nr:hypothetical protein [Spirochaetota bacterium]HQJ70650.1 hypothetical protein [Spirochaetota bacterium]HRS77965.1 hypothetical protein [Spirochaetota bacterium]HRT74734.1 hypothetical protein [Spirochaetota bacterium]
MKQTVLSIILMLSFFMTACEMKDAETETEKCEKKQRELAVLSIAQCSLKYIPGSDDYNLCVNLNLIAFMENYVNCKD